MAKFVVGEAWAELKMDPAQAKRELNRVLPDSEGKSKGKNLGMGMGGAFAASFSGALGALGIGQLVGGVTNFFSSAMTEAKEANKVAAQTEAVLKSTGGAAGKTKEDIERLSSALSAKIGVDDDAIASNANMLLTFTNIRGEIFDRSLPAVQDMTAAFNKQGKDGQAAAVQLGKALQDPIKGVGALSRVGIQFTAQQKEQISTMVEAGDVAGAQGVILAEVERQFKGSAEAQATAMDKAAVAVGNMKEKIGNLLLPVVEKIANFISTTAVPAIEGFINAFQSGNVDSGGFIGFMEQIGVVARTVFENAKEWISWVIDNAKAPFQTVLEVVNFLFTKLGEVLGWLGQHRDIIESIAIAIGVMAGAFAVVIGLIKAWQMAQIALNVVLGVFNAIMNMNPIGLIIIALTALVAGLIYAYKHFEGFRNVVDAAFNFIRGSVIVTFQVFQMFWNWLSQNAWPVIQQVFAAIGGAIAAAWTGIIQPAISAWWNWMQLLWSWLSVTAWPIIQQVFGAIGGAITAVWTGIIQPAISAWWGMMQAVWNWISATAWPVIQQAFQAIGQAINTVWNSIIKPVFENWWQGMQILWSWIQTTAWPVIQQVFAAIGGAISAVWNNIIRPAFDMWQARMSALWDWISNSAWPVVQQVFSAIGGAISSVWNNIIRPAFDMWQARMSALWDWISNTAWPVVQQVFSAIGGAISSVWNNIIKPAFDMWQARMQALWNWIRDTAWPIVQQAFQQIGQIINSVWNNIIKPAFDMWQARMQALWNWIRDTAWPVVQQAFQAIGQAINNVWNNIIRPVFDTWQARMSALWNWIRDTAWPIVQQAFQSIGQAISNVWNNIIRPVFDTWQARMQALWNWIRDTAWPVVQQVFQQIGQIIGNVVEAIKKKIQEWQDKIQAVWNFIQNNAWPALKGLWDELWGRIESVIGRINGKIQEWQDKIAAVWAYLRDQVWPALRGLWDELWGHVEAIVNNLNKKIQEWSDKVTAFWSYLRDEAWPALRGLWDELWGHVEAIINNITEKIQEWSDKVTAFWTYLQDEAWPALKGLWDELWGHVEAIIININDKIQEWRDKVNEILVFFTDEIWPAMRTLWDELWLKVEDILNKIRDKLEEWRVKVDTVRADIEGFLTTLKTKFEEFKTAVVTTWENLRNAIGNVWTEIVTTAKSKINEFGALINKVIDAVNKIPFVGGKIPKLPEPLMAEGGGSVATTSAPQGRNQFRAGGGPVEGGPAGVDTVPAMGPGNQPYMLDNGEHIFTRREVSKMGGQSEVYRFRNMVRYTPSGMLHDKLRRVRMAAGGRVGANNNGLLESHRDHVHVAMDGPFMSYPKIIAKAAESGQPFRPTSTYRPGSRGSGGGLDHHSEGRAVDFGGFNQDAFASFWERTAGVIELIHRTNSRDYAIFGGKSSGGGGGGIFSWLASAAGKLAKKLFDEAISGIKGMLPQGEEVAPTVTRRLMETVIDHATSYFTSSSDASGGPGPGAGSKEVMESAYRTATSMGASRKVLLALFEAGFVESGFRNLGHLGAANDHDSLGFLQQRPSAGWPNPMDVPTATRSFVSRAMAKEGGINNAGALAQAVQISAFPAKYHQHRAQAVAALKQFDPGYDPNGYARGGAIGMQRGGVVPWLPGVGDRVPAMLEPGEQVVSRAQSRNADKPVTAIYRIDKVEISAKDLKEMNGIIEFFNRIEQVAKTGVRG